MDFMFVAFIIPLFCEKVKPYFKVLVAFLEKERGKVFLSGRKKKSSPFLKKQKMYAILEA